MRLNYQALVNQRSECFSFVFFMTKQQCEKLIQLENFVFYLRLIVEFDQVLIAFCSWARIYVNIS